MPALLAGLVSFLGSAIGKIITDRVIAFVALKALLTFLFIIVVPLVLNNFLYDIIEIFMGFINSQSGGASGFNGAMTFSGFSAWLLDVFNVPEAFSVLISALALHVALKMIPFARF